jgi:undecaprenyl-diphosphatase
MQCKPLGHIQAEDKFIMVASLLADFRRGGWQSARCFSGRLPSSPTAIRPLVFGTIAIVPYGNTARFGLNRKTEKIQEIGAKRIVETGAFLYNSKQKRGLTVSVYQAIVLGLVQGIGEFLPISSSGHLVLMPWLFHWETPGLDYDVALHMGTLLAVVLYFRRDWFRLFRAALGRGRPDDRRLFCFLVVASLPAAAAGFLLQDILEESLRSPLITAFNLIFFGVLLYAADRRRQWRTLDNMTLSDALVIGCAQAVALMPGVSRSGITMTAARCFSFSRRDAARFSFLLSTPVIFGAGLFQLRDLSPAALTLPFWLGLAVAALVGLLAIAFLLRFIQRADFKLFVVYRILLGLVIAVLFFRQ